MRSPKPNRPLLVSLFLLLALSLVCTSAPVLAQEGESLILVWTANDEDDLRGYRVYESDPDGNLSNLVGELLVEDIPWKYRFAGIAFFEIPELQPGDHCWAVTAFDQGLNQSLPCMPACITIGSGPPPIHLEDYHEDGFYGSHPKAGDSHDTSVVYTFDGKPGEMLLACRVWDVNTPTEVEIFLNGASLGYAAMTGDYALSPLLTFRIPPEHLETAGLNTLRFDWYPAGANDMWAVGMVEILELIPLPAPDFYGNLANVPSGDTSHPRSAGFMFEGRAGAAQLLYQAYDVDQEGEVGIFLNGERLASAPVTGDNTYGTAPGLILPDHLVLDDDVNTVVFTNALNPPYSLIWGVGAVQISD